MAAFTESQDAGLPWSGGFGRHILQGWEITLNGTKPLRKALLPKLISNKLRIPGTSRIVERCA